MNTPSDLFDLYDSYRGIYEDSEDYLTEKYVRELDTTGRGRDRRSHIGVYNDNGDYLGRREPFRQRLSANGKKVDSYYSGNAGRMRTLSVTRQGAGGIKYHPDHSNGYEHLETAAERKGRRPGKNTIKASVEYVLDYLIDEGFTDSYESAMSIVESMSDEWLEGIIEGYQPITGKRMKRVMTKAADLASTSEKYKSDANLRSQAKKSGATDKEINDVSKKYSKRSDDIIDRISSHDPEKVQQRERQNRRTINVTVSRPALTASVEYVLDYLIDEGYANSYESAMAIVESMSDEWLGSIIEAFNPSDYAEYHNKNHHDEADDRSEQRDQEYLEYLKSKGDIRDKHNDARGVKTKRVKK